MTKAQRPLLGAAVIVLGLMVGAGVASAGPATIALAHGELVANPGFVPGPVANTDVNDGINPALGATGRVHLTIGVGPSDAQRTNATLAVSGLPGGRTFGAHLHRDPCTTSFGGPHYQHPGGTPASGVTPSATNELWLDITTNPSGRGSTAIRVPFAVLAGARSVVVHQLPTNGVGAAGQRLGCLPLAI
jgi:Cu-Zn family superoxide dismutase